MMEKLWTTSEVAQFLGIHEIDVEQLVTQGKLTGYKLGGEFLRFRPDQVQALKGQLQFRPNKLTTTGPRRDSLMKQCQEFFYFYDFYIVAATLLAAVVIYLVVSS